MSKRAIEQAIRRAGGAAALADKLGISRQAVAKWRRAGRPPAERVLALEKLTGVARRKLRPDIYPAEDAR